MSNFCDECGRSDRCNGMKTVSGIVHSPVKYCPEHDDNYSSLGRFKEAFKNTLVLDTGGELYMLLDVDFDREEDIYYVLLDKNNEKLLHSACGRITPLIHYLPEDDYNCIFSSWEYSHKDKGIATWKKFTSIGEFFERPQSEPQADGE
jgi:hypothetical protein